MCQVFIYSRQELWRESLKYPVRLSIYLSIYLSGGIYDRTFITGHVVCIFCQVKGMLITGLDFNKSSVSCRF